MHDIIHPVDPRRRIALPGTAEATLHWCVEHFISCARDAVRDRGRFTVALSGGSTPKAIYHMLSSEAFRANIDWSKVFLFWSDERAVPPTDSESNFNMAMRAGLDSVGVPKDQIFRMQAEEDIVAHALIYDRLISKTIPQGIFDLVMLGLGEDGHIASLFPNTEGLSVERRKAIANFVPQKQCWRMTLTYDAINAARCTVGYVLGAPKASILKRILRGPYQPDELPAQRIGTEVRPALWIADDAAAKNLRDE